jgi:3-hydroxyisobutyrate dehydrogenase-like beta-hydroxyacid dehydrogenase
MKIAALGTGMVGNAIATKLVNVGHSSSTSVIKSV